MCDFSEKTKVFLRRIKYPEEKKCINRIILLGYPSEVVGVVLADPSAWPERRGTESRVIIEIFAKTASKKNFLTVQGNFGKIIDVVRRKLCFSTV